MPRRRKPGASLVQQRAIAQVELVKVSAKAREAQEKFEKDPAASR